MPNFRAIFTRRKVATPKGLRRGVLLAAVALLMARPLFAAQGIRYHVETRIDYILAAVGIIASVAALGALGRLSSLRRRGEPWKDR